MTYWPSTEPSVKRCTCVNKPQVGVKKEYRQGAHSRQAVETGMPKWEPACRGLGLLWPTVKQPQPKCKSAAMVKRRTSHTQQNITLSKIKCERFIFLWRSVFIRLLLKSSLLLTMFPCLYTLYICICMWLYNNKRSWFGFFV